MRRSQLLRLHEDVDGGRVSPRFGRHVVHARPDDDSDAAVGRTGGSQHMPPHRPARDGVQNLGGGGMHPRSLAGGQNDGQEGSSGHLRSSLRDQNSKDRLQLIASAPDKAIRLVHRAHSLLRPPTHVSAETGADLASEFG